MGGLHGEVLDFLGTLLAHPAKRQFSKLAIGGLGLGNARLAYQELGSQFRIKHLPQVQRILPQECSGMFALESLLSLLPSQIYATFA
jgi:hypothetical protein